MPRLLILFLLLCFSKLSLAQKEGNNWCFGNKTGLTFNTSPPSIIATDINAYQYSSCISDREGNLLFYTNGYGVWNHKHMVMENGTGIGFGSSTLQSFIAKKPGSSQYYIFCAATGQIKGLIYTIVDMNLAAGDGSVTVKNEIVSGFAPTQKLGGVMHANGTDVWIVMHELNTNNFRAYLLSASGLDTVPVITSVGSTVTESAGEMRFSHTGKKLCMCRTNFNPITYAELFDFNNATGEVANSVQLLHEKYPATCEFSANGSKLYIANQPGRLTQIDVCAGSPNAVVASSRTITVIPNPVYAVQLGPDGKIYVAGSSKLFVIENPDQPAENLTGHQFTDIHNLEYGLPRFVAGIVKPVFSFSQDLGCKSVSFSAPSLGVSSLAACASAADSPVSLTWNFDDPASGSSNESTNANPTHVFPALGNYEVRLVINYGNRTDTMRRTVSLTNASFSFETKTVSCSAFANPTVIVKGGSGVYDYTWTPGAVTSSVGSNLAPGDYTVFARNKGGTCIQSGTTTIVAPLQVNATIVFTPQCKTSRAAVIVQNSSGNYSFSSVPSGFDKRWEWAGINIGPAIYTLTVIDFNHNCSFEVVKEITRLYTPTLTASGRFIFCPDEKNARIVVKGADMYLWSNGHTGDTLVVAPTEKKLYDVTGTSTLTGCTDYLPMTVIPKPTCDPDPPVPPDPPKDSVYAYKVYPNPVKDKLYIEGDAPITVTVYNNMGVVVLKVEFAPGRNIVYFDSLIDGLYIVIIDNGTKVEKLRIMKD
jgi:PKD repeat protein